MRIFGIALVGIAIAYVSTIGAVENHNKVETFPVEPTVQRVESLPFEEFEKETFTIVEHIKIIGEAEEYSATETEEETETEPIWTPYEFIWLSEFDQVGIKNACDSYQISYELIIAICMQESSLNPNCIGDGGKAFGLGQIREEFWNDTAIGLGLYDWRTDAIQNATMVCYIISKQMNDNHQSMESALNIYRHGFTHDITEPDGLTYVQHIKNNLNWIESQKEEI